MTLVPGLMCLCCLIAWQDNFSYIEAEDVVLQPGLIVDRAVDGGHNISFMKAVSAPSGEEGESTFSAQEPLRYPFSVSQSGMHRIWFRTLADRDSREDSFCFRVLGSNDETWKRYIKRDQSSEFWNWNEANDNGGEARFNLVADEPCVLEVAFLNDGSLLDVIKIGPAEVPPEIDTFIELENVEVPTPWVIRFDDINSASIQYPGRSSAGGSFIDSNSANSSNLPQNGPTLSYPFVVSQTASNHQLWVRARPRGNGRLAFYYRFRDAESGNILPPNGSQEAGWQFSSQDVENISEFEWHPVDANAFYDLREDRTYILDIVHRHGDTKLDVMRIASADGPDPRIYTSPYPIRQGVERGVQQLFFPYNDSRRFDDDTPGGSDGRQVLQRLFDSAKHEAVVTIHGGQYPNGDDVVFDLDGRVRVMDDDSMRLGHADRKARSLVVNAVGAKFKLTEEAHYCAFYFYAKNDEDFAPDPNPFYSPALGTRPFELVWTGGEIDGSADLQTYPMDENGVWEMEGNSGAEKWRLFDVRSFRKVRVQGLQVREFVESGIFSRNCANSIILDCVADGGRSPFANGEFPFNKFPFNFKVHWSALDFEKPPKCVLRDLSCVDCNVGIGVSSTPSFKESSHFKDSTVTIYNASITNTRKSSMNFETVGRLFIGMTEERLPAGNSNVVINSSPEDDGGKIHVANGTIEASFYGIDMFDGFIDFNLGQLASCRVENCNIISDLELIDDGNPNTPPPPAMLHNPLEVVGCTVSAPNADVAIRLANPGGGFQTRVVNTFVDAFLDTAIKRADEVSGGCVIINQTNGGIGTAIDNPQIVTDSTIVHVNEGIFRSLGDLTLDNVQILNTKANPVRMPVGGDGYKLTVTNSHFENFGLDTFEDNRRAGIFGIFDPQSVIVNNSQFVRTNFSVPECCKRSIRFQPGDVLSFCDNEEIDMQLPPTPGNLPCPPSIN